MKNIITYAATCLLISLLSSCNTGTSGNEEGTKLKENEKVAVYYFHFTRRCATCNAVENVTKETLSSLYSKEVVFKDFNLDEKEGQEMGKNLKVSGQSLLILNDSTRIDITNEGFMFALNEPEKLKAILKDNIDPLL